VRRGERRNGHGWEQMAEGRTRVPLRHQYEVCLRNFDLHRFVLVACRVKAAGLSWTLTRGSHSSTRGHQVQVHLR
jgi:hypothetical protein